MTDNSSRATLESGDVSAEEPANRLSTCSSASEMSLRPLLSLDSSGCAHMAHATPPADPSVPDCNPYHLMGMPSPDECCLPHGAYGPDRLTPVEQQLCDLYDKLGGWELMSAAVQKLYYRLFNDANTCQYFIGKDQTRLMSKMTSFLASAFTGRLMYPPAKIYAIHADMIENMALSVVHVDIVLDHLEDVLQELGVSAEDRLQARSCLSTARHVFKPRRPRARRHSAQPEASSRPHSRRASTHTDPTTARCMRARRSSAHADEASGASHMLREITTGLLEQLHHSLAISTSRAPRGAAARRYSHWDPCSAGSAALPAADMECSMASRKAAVRRASTGSVAWLQLAGALAPSVSYESNPKGKISSASRCPFPGNLSLTHC